MALSQAVSQKTECTQQKASTKTSVLWVVYGVCKSPCPTQMKGGDSLDNIHILDSSSIALLWVISKELYTC